MNAPIVVLFVSLGVLVAGSIFLTVKEARTSARTAIAVALFAFSQIAIVGFLAVILAAAGDACPLGVSVFVLVMSVLCVFGDACLARATKDALARGETAVRICMLEDRVGDLRAREEALAFQACRAQAVRERMADELAEAERLLKGPHASEAMSHAQHAVDLLGGSGAGNRLCEHPVIDALLARKREACADKEIRFEAQMGVPASIGLPTPVLVAVFANALDNAIASCVRTPVDDRFVEVRARVEAGFLVVSVRNACDGSEAFAGIGARSKRGIGALLDAMGDGSVSEHGWGTGIMRDLAERFGGLFRARCQGGVFEVRMVLKAEEAS